VIFSPLARRFSGRVRCAHRGSRGAHVRVEVVPFDVLSSRAHAILDNVERYLLTAEEQTADDE
jgi:hypothetical protein